MKSIIYENTIPDNEKIMVKVIMLLSSFHYSSFSVNWLNNKLIVNEIAPIDV